MIHALFLTTKTSECQNHVLAWEAVFGRASRMDFDHLSLRNDWMLVERAELLRPAVIFYIGACNGRGNPRPDTFRNLRKIAPLVNLCSDAADYPWHPVLAEYKAEDCFDLQVALDGAREAPVDLATLTPVHPGRFAFPKGYKDIRCGFSGTVGRHGTRHDIIRALERFGCLKVRNRAKSDGYGSHASFLGRCHIVFNTSWTGTGKTHHVKGRVLEAGWAECALLEPAPSPIGRWFPEDCYFTYSDLAQAAAIIREASPEQIGEKSRNLARYCAKQYHPARIYGEILERLRLVRTAVSWSPAEYTTPGTGVEGDRRNAARALEAGR